MSHFAPAKIPTECVPKTSHDVETWLETSNFHLIVETGSMLETPCPSLENTRKPSQPPARFWRMPAVERRFGDAVGIPTESIIVESVEYGNRSHRNVQHAP